MELLPDGTTRRIIRARLTIRGFKDRDAQDLIRYAGTSQRYSQRMIVSEAANRGWNIVTTDIYFTETLGMKLFGDFSETEPFSTKIDDLGLGSSNSILNSEVLFYMILIQVILILFTVAIYYFMKKTCILVL